MRISICVCSVSSSGSVLQLDVARHEEGSVCSPFALLMKRAQKAADFAVKRMAEETNGNIVLLSKNQQSVAAVFTLFSGHLFASRAPILNILAATRYVMMECS